MKQTELSLWIETCSCKCGQRWTNSFLTYPMGGTPNPQDEDRLQPTRIIPALRSYSHCFRCAPLGLGIGWQDPAAGRATSSQPIEDLLS